MSTDSYAEERVYVSGREPVDVHHHFVLSPSERLWIKAMSVVIPASMIVSAIIEGHL